MGRVKVKKVQFNISIDPRVLDRINELDRVLNRFCRNDSHGNKMDNISRGEYWEGVIREHLNSDDILRLLTRGRDIVDDGI